jgi:hypothetical protein
VLTKESMHAANVLKETLSNIKKHCEDWLKILDSNISEPVDKETPAKLSKEEISISILFLAFE